MSPDDLPIVDPKDSDPVLKVHNMKFKRSFLDSNQKISDYEGGKPCPKCRLPMDAGEGPICKYCTREYFHEIDVELWGDDDG